MATVTNLACVPHEAHVRGGQVVLVNYVTNIELAGATPVVTIGGQNAAVLHWRAVDHSLIVRVPAGVAGAVAVRVAHSEITGGYYEKAGALTYVAAVRRFYFTRVNAYNVAPVRPGVPSSSGKYIAAQTGFDQSAHPVGTGPLSAPNAVDAYVYLNILLPAHPHTQRAALAGMGLQVAGDPGNAEAYYATAGGAYMTWGGVTYPLYGATQIPAGTWRFRGQSHGWGGMLGSQADQICIFVRHFDGTVTKVIDTSTSAVRRTAAVIIDSRNHVVAFDIAVPEVTLIDGDQIGVEWWGRNYSASGGQWTYHPRGGDNSVDLGTLSDGADCGAHVSGGVNPGAPFIELPEDLFFVPEPPLAISSITPDHGPAFGGTDVTIEGVGFTGATGATVGGVALTDFTVVDDTTITGKTGRHAPASDVDVVVGEATLAGAYDYENTLIVIPDQGPDTGGNRVRVKAYGIGDGTVTLPSSEEGIGTGMTYSPLHVAVTGGGAFPGYVGGHIAPDISGLTDSQAFTALQNAVDAAAAMSRPLVFPGGWTGAVNEPLIAHTSLLWNGQGVMPRLKQNAASGLWQAGSGIILPDEFTGWIFGLRLTGNFDTTNDDEWAHNISLRGVNGVTIKGCLLELTRGDGISDNATDAGSAVARNVLVDGNTIDARWRCCASFTGKSNGWAYVNNLFRYVDSTYQAEAWANGSSAIDLEPEGGYDAFVENIEISYNRFIYSCPAAAFVPVVQATAWFDQTPGRNIFAHHNYGVWNRPDFFGSFSYQGQGAIFFENVQHHDNAQGETVPA